MLPVCCLRLSHGAQMCEVCLTLAASLRLAGGPLQAVMSRSLAAAPQPLKRGVAVASVYPLPLLRRTSPALQSLQICWRAGTLCLTYFCIAPLNCLFAGTLEGAVATAEPSTAQRRVHQHLVSYVALFTVSDLGWPSDTEFDVHLRSADPIQAWSSWCLCPGHACWSSACRGRCGYCCSS